MATFQITGPDGKKYKVSGANAQGAYEALMKHLGNPAGGGANGANRPASAETTRPEDTGGFGTRDNPLAPVEAPEIPGQGAVAAQAPASADARPSFPGLPQPLATPQAPDRALVEAMTTPPPPPVRPRSADPLTFGMMGGLGQDQEDWARREISRIEAERAAAGGLPPRPRPRPVDLAPMQEPVTPDQPQYTPTGEAIFAELGNAPERVARGFAGNDLLAAERGIHVNLTDIGAIKRGASELAAVEQQMTAMKAEMNANPRRAPDLQDAYLELAAKRNQLRALYGSALDMIQTERGELSDDQRARYNAQTRVDTLEAQMTPVSAKPGLSRAVVSGISSVADMAPGLVTSLVTKNPLPMMAYLGAYSRGSTYVDKRAEGYSPEKASRAANLYALAEAIPEALPLHVILKKGGGALWKIGGGAATEAASEVLTQGLQTLVDMGVLDERMTWAEASAAMAESGMAGGVMGSLMGGGAVLADNVADSVAKRKEREGTPADPRPNQPSMATPRDSRQKDDAATVAPSQPAAPSQDPLAAALMPDAAPQPPRADPEQSPAPQADAVPTPPNATPEQPADAGRFEIMDEVETVDGETRLTGRKVRVNLQTGQASVVEANEAAAVETPPAASAPAPTPPVNQPQAPDAGAGAGSIPPAVDSAPTTPAEPPADKPRQAVEVLTERDIANIGTDAKTFQYKDGGDDQGVTDRLRGVKTWEPERAGISLVYEYADGRRVVADGHQRLGLAKRLAAEGQPIQLPVRVLREVDGITPEQARARAALKNIAEGTGTATDAAKVLRDTARTPAELNLPPNSAIVRDAAGLQRLSNEAFGMVVNGVSTEQHGGIVGRLVENRDAQAGILSLLNKLKPRNAFEAESIVRQAAAETTTETQDSLFGTEQITANLYLERARVLDGALRRLKDDIKTFRTLTDRADAIASVGNQLVTEENQSRLDQDAKVRDYLTSQANMKGPISEALSAAARDYKDTGKLAPAVGRFVESVRRAVDGSGEGGDGGRQGGQAPEPAGGAKPPAESPQAEVAPAPAPEPAAPAGDDLFNAMLPQQTGKSPEQIRAEAEAKVRAGQSKMRKPGGNSGDAGPLFDDQPDLLNQKPAAPEAKPNPVLEMRRQAIETADSYRQPNDAPSTEYGDLLNDTLALDLLTDLAAASGLEARARIADAWVLERGKSSGVEHLVALDKDGQPLAVGRGTKSNIAFTPHFQRMAKDGRIAYATHNHPSSRGFSVQDINMAMSFGVRVVAIGHNGNRHEMTALLGAGGTSWEVGKGNPQLLQALTNAEKSLASAIQAKIDAMSANPVAANKLVDRLNQEFHNIMSLIWHDLGIIAYDGDATASVARFIEDYNDIQAIIDTATERTAARIGRAGFDVAAPGNRSADRTPAEGTTEQGDPNGNRAPDGAAGRGERDGRLPEGQSPVTDDFDGALDDIYGAPEPQAVAPQVKTSGDRDYASWASAVPSPGRQNGWTIFDDTEVGGSFVLKTRDLDARPFATEAEARAWAKDNAPNSFRKTTEAPSAVSFPTELSALVPQDGIRRYHVTAELRGQRYYLGSAVSTAADDLADTFRSDAFHRSNGRMYQTDDASSSMTIHGGAEDFRAAVAALAKPVETRPAPAPPAAAKPARNKSDIAKDLGNLFSEPEGFREDGFDQSRYERAIPLFTEALDGIDVDAMPRREVFAAMIRPLAAAGLPREAVAKMRPYFERFLVDRERGMLPTQEDGDVSGPGGDLERDRGDADTGDTLGGTDVPTAGGRSGGRSGRRGTASGGRGGRRSGGERLPGGDAAPVGTGSDPELQGDGRAGQQPADGGDGAAGGDRGQQGLPADEAPASHAGGTARDGTQLKDRAALQRAADERARRGIKTADEADIRASLPLLLPEQQDDVLKVERRFAKPDGHGMMITNGTGTGKTYSGGGVIKRFAQAGKTNILIVAPSQGILDHWVAAGADLGLSISKLDDTSTAGTGIVATTYANLGANGILAGREWDLVVADESHSLSRNQTGDATSALRNLRAITNRPADLWHKFHMQQADRWARIEALKEGPEKNAAVTRFFADRDAFIKAEAQKPRGKVLFLSATPFAYDVNTDYAEGYLFNYPADGRIGNSRQSGRNLFMVENFGYRIRYHKLTKPEAAVDSGVFERQFHEKLKRDGVLSGRHLDIEPDYERRFVQTEDAEGAKIDGILDFIREKSRERTPEGQAYARLLRFVERRFNYLKRMQLLEAIKARSAQATIDHHLALGRKIVIFHDYNQGGGFNPFRPDQNDGTAAMLAPESEAGQDEMFAQAGQEGYDLLVQARPEVENLNFAGYLPPVQELKKRYGDRAAVYNGTVSNKDRAKAKSDFNKDGSGVDIIIVQSAAGEAGISLHDLSGAHHRALINLGMPTRPTTALQEEGRIRREGSVSNAIFQYMTIGTTWERQAFAAKIAERSGAVENLALGNEARAIRESFIDAYNDAGPWTPGEGDGTGGKAKDRRRALVSPYDEAKTHYFGRTRTSGRRDQREGLDFYPTPEPLAFKMVEWAGIRPYERALEPSAGDGSIARYMPDHADRTIIEPSADLLSLAQLRAVGARPVQSTFEDYHIVNKFNAIVMNPPFGSGGKTAIEHLAKAARHLKPGGRIVALIPTGPAADKRFDAWWDSADFVELVKTADITLPAVTFERAGTTVMSRVVIIDKIPVPSQRDRFRDETGGERRINMSSTGTIAELFDRLEAIEAPARPEQTVDPIEEVDAESTAPERPAPPVTDVGFRLGQTVHAKTGDDLFVATATARVDRDAYTAMLAVAKAHGGWYSAFKGRGAIPGFQFKSEAQRAAFIEDMQKPTLGMQEPAYHGSPHEFDRFSLDHIGSGEGAQVYGWGLYFAGRREVAEYYKRTLARTDLTLNGAEVPEWLTRDPSAEFHTQMTAFLADEPAARPQEVSEDEWRKGKPLLPYAIKNTLTNLRDKVRYDGDDPVSRLGVYRSTALAQFKGSVDRNENPYEYIAKLGAIDWLEQRVGRTRPARLYKVEVPEVSEMLDYDAPLSKQPQAVRTVLRDLLPDMFGAKGESLWTEQPETAMTRRAWVDQFGWQIVEQDGGFFSVISPSSKAAGGRNIADKRKLPDAMKTAEAARKHYAADLTGRDAYNMLSVQQGGDRAASEALRAAGIPGHRYLDGSSRSAGEGSHNYVIYDDSRIEITGFEEPDSPAFRTWFANSKVVDEAGKPLVVYHGSNSRQIEAFEIGRPSARYLMLSQRDVVSQGVFFSPSETDALNYGPNVTSVYLSVQNPLTHPQNFPVSSRDNPAVKAKAKKLWDDFEYIMAPAIDENGYIDTNGGVSSIKVDNLGMWMDDVMSRDDAIDWFHLDNADVVARMKERGYDGVKVHEPDDESGFSWMVFDPAQIKSATKNSGTFDPADPRIKYQQDGIVGHETSELVRRAMPALRAELDRLDLKRVRLERAMGVDWQGAFEAGDDMRIIIGASLDPMATLRHEVIHALRAMDLFTPAEWKALTLKAAQDWMDRYDIAARYPNLDAAEQIEEAIAEAYSDALAQKKAPEGSILITAFNKIARLMRAFRNVLNGAGFQTYEDVFGRVQDGTVSARPGNTMSDRALSAPSRRFQAQDMASEVDRLAKDLKAEFNLRDLSMFLSRGNLKLNMIAVAKDSQGEGIGTQVMGRIANFADANGLRIILSPGLPDDGFGTTSRARLVRFYRRFGFVENKGRNKDFAISEGMYREPQGFGEPSRKFQRARLPSRQARAHMATSMQGAAYIPDRRIWEELTRASASIWERIGHGAGAAHDAVDRARIYIQDRFLPVLRAQQAVSALAGQPLTASHNAYIAETQFSGKVGRHLFEIDHEYTKPIIDIIAATNGGLTAESVGEWLYARHAIERNAHIASINPAMPDGGSGMTTADAGAILAQAAAGPHAAALGRIGALLDRLRERTLKLREDAGLISPTEANIWRSQYKHYVPLKGFAETDHSEAMLDVTGVGRRFNTRGEESKRALGRRSEAFNPLVAAITQAQEVAVRAEKNIVGHSVYNLARDFPSPALWSVKAIKMKRFYNRTTGLVETRPENPVSLFMDPNEMAVKIGGKEYRVMFHDPRLARALGSVGADQMNWFVRMMSAFGRWFSMTRTMLNPEFVITNAFRDLTTAQINIHSFGKGDRNAIAKAMIKSWPKAFVGAWRGQGGAADTEWTRYYREFERAGAKVSFWTLEQPEAGLRDFDRRIWLASGSRARRILKATVSPSALFSTRDNGVLHVIERTNMAVDNAIRLAAFVEARKRGWSEGEAAALAKNLTVNFNRRGEASATINALYTFFNAAVQGSVNTVKALATSRRVQAIAVGLVAAGFLNDLSNAWLSEEDDDEVLAYDKIPDWQSQRAINFMLGRDSGTAVSIPLPYGWNVFPYFGQQIGKIARGVKKPDDAMADMAAAIMGAFSPVQGGDLYAILMPTSGDPLLEMARNLDWRGRPIKPDYSFDLKPESQKAFGGASEMAKWVAEAANSMTGGTSGMSGAIDISPEYIDHTMTFLTGSAGAFAGRTVDLLAKAATGNLDETTANDVPFLRIVVKDTYPGLDRDRYFLFRDRIEKATYAVKAAKENGETLPDEVRRWASLAGALKGAEKMRKEGKEPYIAFNAKVTRLFGAIGE